jgi:hypothetical protein
LKLNNNTKLLWVKNWAAWTPNSLISTTSIPPNIKRRCSKASIMALATANQALASYSIDYAIFFSQHGELGRAVEILKNIYHKEILSPMNFAQSVHNSAAGLFSIIHRLHQNINSIAAGDNTFLMGMVEAFTWLELNPQQTILLTIFDDNIPDEYRSLAIKSNYQYAVSLLLTNDLAQPSALVFSLDFIKKLDSRMRGNDGETVRGNDGGTLPQALEFLQWLQSHA